MVALKPAEFEGLVHRRAEKTGLVLVYGPDEGLVRERSAALVRATAGTDTDPFSLVRLDGTEVAADPGRLVDEATTISMFGNRRIVWVRDAGGRNLLPAVQPLLARPPADCLVVIEAGDLKKGTGLRKAVEDHPNAVAVPCYADTPEDISRLVRRELDASGLAIDADARDLLERQLGADRLASRAEIEKLCLYARGSGRIDVESVMAIVGDASAFAMDELIDATAGGDVTAADAVLAKLVRSGTPTSVAGGALIRHFQLLERARAAIRPGKSAQEVVAEIQPPVFFRRRPNLVRQLALWTPERLARALRLLDQAMWQSRRTAALADAVITDAVITLARVARSGRR